LMYLGVTDQRREAPSKQQILYSLDKSADFANELKCNTMRWLMVDEWDV